jgi:hypothetical protein
MKSREKAGERQKIVKAEKSSKNSKGRKSSGQYIVRF